MHAIFWINNNTVSIDFLFRKREHFILKSLRNYGKENIDFSTIGKQGGFYIVYNFIQQEMNSVFFKSCAKWGEWGEFFQNSMYGT